MGKTGPLCGAVLFFSACDHTTQQKPDSDRVIKDTLAQIILRPFNEAPDAHEIYVRVEAKETHFLCARNAAITQLEEDIKNPPQRYLINPATSNNLEALNGTQISLQPDCFMDKKGKTVISPVEISVKECYRPGELLAENIATANDNNTIEAKGAVFIHASISGEDLGLKEGKSINVSLPISTHGNTYQLFYGKEDAPGELSWKMSNVPRKNPYDIVMDKQFTKPAFSSNGLGLADYLHEIIKYPTTPKSMNYHKKSALVLWWMKMAKWAKFQPTSATKLLKPEYCRCLQICRHGNPHHSMVSMFQQFCIWILISTFIVPTRCK